MKRKVSFILSIFLAVSLFVFPSAGFAEENDDVLIQNEITSESSVEDAGVGLDESSTGDVMNETVDQNSSVVNDDMSLTVLQDECSPDPQHGNKVADGKCGDFAFYTLYEDGFLDITGVGNMYDYNFGKAPWFSEFRKDIKEISIGTGITGVGKSAFYNCSSVSKAVISGSVDKIGDYAFYECEKLSEVSVEYGLTNIGKYAFSCTALKSVNLPESLETIGNSAFEGCTKMTAAELPQSLETIGKGAFMGCEMLESVEVPCGVKTLPSCAFSGCSGLSSVSMVSGLETIGVYAFKGCSSLESVTVPATVSTVSENAFYGCDNLGYILFEGNAPEIDSEAFCGVIATAGYYCFSDGWNESTLINYGGDITWKLEHKSVVHSAAKAATCTKNGASEYCYCDDCGRYFSDEACSTEIEKDSWIIPATGHTYSPAWTYNTIGHWHKCLSGDSIKDYSLHDAVIDPGYPATYTTTGLTVGSHCSVCGKVIVEQQVIPVLTENVPLYRLYNPRTGEHLYTESAEERDNLSAGEWTYEGVNGMMPVISDCPMYRVYNPNSGDHHYTGSMEEVNNCVNAGWKFEGIAFYSGGSTPVFRMYNPNAYTGIHHYTASITERDYLISVGWIYEGIGWYQM